MGIEEGRVTEEMKNPFFLNDELWYGKGQTTLKQLKYGLKLNI